MLTSYFLIALVLVVPLARTARATLVSAAFLAEFLTAGELRTLSRLTDPPTRQPLAVPGAAVDVYLVGERPAAPLVLVHGLTPDGKDDARVRQAAGLLARAGFEVAVPAIEGLTRWRLRPEDRAPVVGTLAARAAPTTVIAVSVGAGPALLAVADPAVRDRVGLVLSLGGYASARELARFYLTGEYAYGAARGRVAHDPELTRLFLQANADLMDVSARRVLSVKDPAAMSASLDAVSPGLARLLDALSPERIARDIPARLVLVHGLGDIAVPYSETLRLAAARPERTRVVLVGVVGHVEGAPASVRWSELRDLLALWTVMYAVVARA